jgi:hypothetical protein
MEENAVSAYQNSLDWFLEQSDDGTRLGGKLHPSVGGNIATISKNQVIAQRST